VPELIQDDMTPESLARETLALLESESARQAMRRDLAEVSEKLSGVQDPLEVAAALVESGIGAKQSKEEMVHVS
jgi:lipid A disaccharide synthetase